MWISVFAIIVIGLIAPGEKAAQQHKESEEISKSQIIKLKIPPSLRAEHAELLAELSKAVNAEGDTAKAAQMVANLLHPHFVKEEEFALPPLGLLPRLAEGKVKLEMIEALMLTDRLQASLPQMLKEHKGIMTRVEQLSKAAKKENKVEFVRLAEKLTLHVQQEEEVLYPAALLVGEYLKLKLNRIN
jgi:hypothetical protein